VVEQAGGGFTATFTTDNADCGLATGTATITVDPAAEYTYTWSNQQTGPILQQEVAGSYSVVVTDMNSCTEEFSVTIDQDPAEYISVVNTSPGNCNGGGDITFTLTTPGAGPLNVQVEGPQGTMPLSLSPGTYQLSSFITVLPGTYTFTVYDEQIGNKCIEVVSATVDDNTPALIVADDFYTTPAGQALFENALDNDSGLDIQMTAVGDVFGGAVTFNASGDFTFIPEPGFNGDASFTYTVTDICGNTSTGIVTILVEQVNCDFNVTFQVTPASCGLADGMITAVVSPPGSYSFIWSTGDAGPTLNNVAAGPYSVTVTDNNLGCDLDFTTNVPENPAEYISDIVITQPSCSDPGDIQFTATSNTPGELVMNVIHPNGLDIFFIDPGVVRLSDFVSITPGDYTIEIIDPEAGTDCFEFFEATLNPAQMLQIATEAVFPPSEPTAMDGSAIIVVIVPGVFPYTVLVNEVPYQTANTNTIQINGLGVGEYVVQIIDATGCMSNVLLVIIPFPDIILSFGTGISNVSYDVANEQPNVPTTIDEWRNGLWVSVKYPVKGLRQELQMMYMIPQTGGGNAYAPGILQLEHMTDIKRMHWKKIQFGLQGGIGMQYMNQDDQFLVPDTLKQYWTIQSSAGFSVAKKIRLQGNFSVQGWAKVERPVAEISFSIRP
jgi:large repetitive protein